MSRIDDLVAEFAAEGVHHEPLGQVGVWYGGGTPSKARPEYWKDGTIPWVSPKDMGRSIVDSSEDYITEVAVKGSATRLVPANSVAVVVRSSILDRILPTALIPMPVALNQDMKAVVAREGVLPGYLANIFRSRGPAILRFARKTGGSVASIESSKLFSFRIPVPPIEVQLEVVRTLDHFAKLEAGLEVELKAELEARRRQYTHYRDALLRFDERTMGASKQAIIAWIPMGDVGMFIRGRRFTKDDIVKHGIPAIHYGEIYTRYGAVATSVVTHLRPELASNLRFAEPGDVIIVDVGETVEDVGKAVAWIGSEKVAIHDHSFAFRHSQNPSFLSYYLQTAMFQREKAKYVARTKVKTLSMPGIARIRIPVPPLEEQERIVSMLEKFDALVNGLSVGLPAELASRRQQYAYYRDRLLTFPEARDVAGSPKRVDTSEPAEVGQLSFAGSEGRPLRDGEEAQA